MSTLMINANEMKCKSCMGCHAPTRRIYAWQPRVPLDEPQLPEVHPRTRKAFSTITRLKNETLALPLIKTKGDNLINQTKILPKNRQNPVCNEAYPMPRNINKTFILNPSIPQWETQAVKIINHTKQHTNHEKKSSVYRFTNRQ